jgi:hypothetical protein
MKFELVENARHAWKWLSMQCMAGATALQGAWLMAPDDMKASLPPHLVSGICIALLVIGMIGRVQAPKAP